MTLHDYTELPSKVRDALRATFSDLIASNRTKTFYAFAVWTDDSLQFFNAAANTEEGLTSTVDHYRKEVDPKYGNTSTRNSMRWSYGDWEYFPIDDDNHLAEIDAIVRRNFDADENEFMANVDSLWQALLDGFVLLNEEGFFGTGDDRSGITLMLVGHVPEEKYEQWITTLNPPDVAKRCLEWDYDAPDTDAN